MKKSLTILYFVGCIFSWNYHLQAQSKKTKKKTPQKVSANSSLKKEKTEKEIRIAETKRLITKVLKAKKNPGNPFTSIQFSKAVLYQFDCKQYESNRSLFKANSQKLIPMEDEKVLNALQASEIIAIVGDTNTYGNIIAACFAPHHGVIFYDAKNKPIAHIAICMGCNYLKSSPFIDASLFHSQILMINDEKVVFSKKGFSKLGRKKLANFFKKCGLNYRQVKSPVPDR